MEQEAFQTLALETDRLILKTLDPSFAARVLDFFVRNRQFFQEWWPTVDPQVYSVEFQRARLQTELDLAVEDRMVRLWIFDKADTAFERVVGFINFSNIVRGAFQSCHLGYATDHAEINQGVMTEALQRAIGFAFDNLKLHRIEANIMPKNTRSSRVVEKLGFVNEGLSRKYLKINGVWEDHIHYVILNDALE